MIDLRRLHHTGMAVSDIDEAQATMGASMSLEWAPVRCFDPLPFWTPERGAHDLVVYATYSRPGPHHIELVQGMSLSLTDPNNPQARHLGIWSEELAAEADRLVKNGWRVMGAATSPAEGYGIICYLEAPMRGLMIELISTDLEATIAEWIAG